ncbi:MAG: hypothetical protein U0790_19360 [Isosphaeraceae bacterium]
MIAVHADDRSYRAGVGAEGIPRDDGDNLATYNRIYPTNYQRLALLDIAEGANEHACDMAARPRTLDRRTDPGRRWQPAEGRDDLRPLPRVCGPGDHNLYDASETRLSGLEPGKPRLVIVKHFGRKLGAIVNLPADRATDPAELTLVLRPCAIATGRLVDAEGKPSKGAWSSGPGGERRPISAPSGSARPGWTPRDDSAATICRQAMAMRSRPRIAWSTATAARWSPRLSSRSRWRRA